MPTSKARRERRKQLRSEPASSPAVAKDIDAALVPTISALEKEISEAASIQPSAIEANPDVQLRGVPGKGRGLFWCPADGRMLKKGTTILRLQPEMMVPNEHWIRHLCHVCYSTKGKHGSELKCCPDCKLVRYCSDSCKALDEALHQIECRALSSMDSGTGSGENAYDPGTRVRLMARLIWQRRQMSEEWWARIESLVVHPRHTNLPEASRAVCEFADYLIGRQSMSGDRDADLARLKYPSMKALDELHSRMIYNGYDSISSTGTKLGLVIDTVAAMSNHSCTPSTNLVWPNGPGARNPIHFVAVKDIQAGEELEGPYNASTLPYLARQKQLAGWYLFTCRCALCMEGHLAQAGLRIRVDPREALYCGRKGCNGWVTLETIKDKSKGLCTGCKLPNIQDHDKVCDALLKGEELYSQLDNNRNAQGSHDALLSSCQLIKALTDIQPPSSHPLFGLLRHSFFIFIKWMDHKSKYGPMAEMTKFREEAIRVGLLYMEGLQAGEGDGMLPEGDLLRMTALAQLAAMMCTPLGPHEAEWATKYASTSFCLSRWPKYPNPSLDRDNYRNCSRMKFGYSLAEKAVKEIKIGFGNDADRCELRTRLQKAIDNPFGGNKIFELELM